MDYLKSFFCGISIDTMKNFVVDLVQRMWFLPLVLVGLVLILLVILAICAVKISKQKRKIAELQNAASAQQVESQELANERTMAGSFREPVASHEHEPQDNTYDQQPPALSAIERIEATIAKQEESAATEQPEQITPAKQAPKKETQAKSSIVFKTAPRQKNQTEEQKASSKQEQKNQTEEQKASSKQEQKNQTEEQKASSKAKSEEVLEVIEVEGADGSSKVRVSEGYVINFDRAKNNWKIRKMGEERATRRAATKEEAVKIGKELSRKYDLPLIIQKKDGRFQKQR